MLDALRYGLSNYFNFQGRTDRATFWWYVLAVFLILFVTGIIDAVIFGTPAPEAAFDYATRPISALVALCFIIPNIAMAVRRLHDIGKSGWWLLIGFIPFLGALVLLYFYIQPSSES